MAEIQLKTGQTILIDDADLPIVERYKWYASKRGAAGRPVRSAKTDQGSYVDSPLISLLMPEAGKGRKVVHLNGNKFDVRRENLSLVTSKGRRIAPLGGSTLMRGVVGELEVAADLFRHGYEVFAPMHGYSRYDLIALDANGRPYRIQVKSGTSKAGRLVISLRSISTNAGGHKSRPLDLENLDILAAYDLTTRQVGYFARQDIASTHSATFSLQSRSARHTRHAVKEGPNAVRYLEDFTDPADAMSRLCPDSASDQMRVFGDKHL